MDLSLLKELISLAPVSADIDTVNRVSDRLSAWLRAKGVRVVCEEIEGRRTLYASALPEGKCTEILFNAHLDVVPATTPEQHTPIEKDGRLYGRGANDCLGRAVVIAELLAGNPGKSAAAIFSMDEEIGGKTTAGMLDRGYAATRGAVILDSWREGGIAIAEKGMMNIRITAHGRGGHAAYPWEANNAIDLLVRAYAKLLDAWKNPLRNDNWEDSISATGIECSSRAHNVIPETATLRCNIRFTQPGGEEAILKRIRELTGLEDVELTEVFAPVFVGEDSPFLETVRRAAEEIRGYPVSCYRMNGATDARHIAERFPGLPIVIDGARSAHAHNADEWVDLEDLDILRKVYQKVLNTL